MPLDTGVDANLISDMEKEMSNKAETNAGAESKEKSLDLGEEESSKSRLNAEKKIELEKWKQVLMGQQFVRDNSSPFPGQYNPADQSVCWSSLLLTPSVILLLFKSLPLPFPLPLALPLALSICLTPFLGPFLRLAVDVNTEFLTA